MKLIDVDKIIITRQEYVGALTLKERLRRLLESQPTVEAIPIEWIEKYAKRFIELENRNYFAYRGFSDIGEAILNMLENWEKENALYIKMDILYNWRIQVCL